jgi:curved DNA-binding protein CbpA
MTSGFDPYFDPYKVLQVDPEAEVEVIEAAFRRLARKYHPDVMPGPEAAARMVALNRAWDLLRDPRRRALVDRQRIDAAASRTSGPQRPAPTQRPAGTRPAAGPAASGSGSAPPGAYRSAANPAVADPQTSAGGARAGRDAGSGNWSSGRSSIGGGYDPATMRAADGPGAAGPPPGNPSGSVLRFGRYEGWSLGEIAGRDLEFLEWLDRMPIGRPYRDEIDALLRRARRRTAPSDLEGERRGLFRRR